MYVKNREGDMGLCCLSYLCNLNFFLFAPPPIPFTSHVHAEREPKCNNRTPSAILFLSVSILLNVSQNRPTPKSRRSADGPTTKSPFHSRAPEQITHSRVFSSFSKNVFSLISFFPVK